MYHQATNHPLAIPRPPSPPKKKEIFFFCMNWIERTSN